MMDKKFFIKRVLLLVMCFVMVMGTVSVCASSKKTVGTQKKLISEMKKSKEITLVLKSDKALKISIPKKKKSTNKTLIIEAPDATIINKANFKAITIKEAKSYTEKASGNVIALKSDSIPVTIYKGSNVKKLTVPSKNANIKLQKKATIEVMEYSTSYSDISCPVIVTVKGGTKLDLSGSVVDVIKIVNDDNGFVYDFLQPSILTIDEFEDVYRLHFYDDYKTYWNEKKYVIGLSLSQSSRNLYRINDESCPGGLMYTLHINEGVLEGLSLFDGWNGDVSEIYNFMNDKNCFGAHDFYYLVFKNGKIINLAEIFKSYKDEVEKVIELYDLSLINYYMETRNWTFKQVDRYRNGILTKLWGWGLDIDKMTDDEYQCFFTCLCVEMAMCDWAANEDGTIKNYGCILINKPESYGLTLYINCPHDEVVKLEPRLKKK